MELLLGVVIVVDDELEGSQCMHWAREVMLLPETDVTRLVVGYSACGSMVAVEAPEVRVVVAKEIYFVIVTVVVTLVVHLG